MWLITALVCVKKKLFLTWRQGFQEKEFGRHDLSEVIS